MNVLVRALLCVSLVTVASTAAAQVAVTVDTVQVPERSSYEDGYLSRFSMDRTVPGARARAMGGAGLALLGGAESQGLNAAAILGITSPQLESEVKVTSGGASVRYVPTLLQLGENQTLTARNYRIRPREDLEYSSLALGIPVVMLGNRGALALTYRRSADSGAQDETRVELRGPITNQADATFGLGDIPTEGMDAISVAAARRITDWFDVGVNVNWQSGMIKRKKDVGVAVFGFEILSSSTDFQQEVSGSNIDLGGRLEIPLRDLIGLNMGPLTLAGTMYLSHDLKFQGARATVRPLPDPQDPGQQTLIRSRPLDHTLSVPTLYGFGAGLEVNDRLTLAADLWLRPWDKATITRARIDPVVGFADPADSSTYYFQLPTVAGETETFGAGLWNTNSIRVGAEYKLSHSENFDLPFRVGFRSERLTRMNVAIPDTYASYVELRNQYWRALRDGQTEDAARYQGELERVAEFNTLLFQGQAVKAKTITFGFGVRIENFSADLSVERVSYDTDRFFLQDFDPLLNPLPSVVQEKRSLMNLSFATRMRF